MFDKNLFPAFSEEKRKDIVYGFLSFRTSVRPYVCPSICLSIVHVVCISCAQPLLLYSFIPILLRLHRCLDYALKMCM